MAPVSPVVGLSSEAPVSGSGLGWQNTGVSAVVALTLSFLVGGFFWRLGRRGVSRIEARLEARLQELEGSYREAREELVAIKAAEMIRSAPEPGPLYSQLHQRIISAESAQARMRLEEQEADQDLASRLEKRELERKASLKRAQRVAKKKGKAKGTRTETGTETGTGTGTGTATATGTGTGTGTGAR